MRTVGSVMVLAVTATLAACGSGSPPGPTTSASVVVAAAPSPITGALCTGCGAGSTDREAATTLTVQETAGVAATVTAIEMTLREQGTNAVMASGSFEGAAVSQLAGSNRVAARGTLSLRCGVHYAAAQAGKAAILTYVVRLVDERGNQIAQTLAVTVTST